MANNNELGSLEHADSVHFGQRSPQQRLATSGAKLTGAKELQAHLEGPAAAAVALVGC
jgi:hypothetical protein